MPIGHTLLGLLEREPMHGYLLRQQSKDFAWIYPMASASIYPALHDLESKGFILHRQEIHNGRARKVYEITPEGRQEQARWLSAAPTASSTLRDRTLLQLSMQNDDSLKRSRRWIEQQIERSQQDIERYARRLEVELDISKYERLSLEYGIDLMKLRSGYLQRVTEQCEGEAASVPTPQLDTAHTPGPRMAAAASAGSRAMF
jgi:DNA-binding PadR family transcriptional regulator